MKIHTFKTQMEAYVESPLVLPAETDFIMVTAGATLREHEDLSPMEKAPKTRGLGTL